MKLGGWGGELRSLAQSHWYSGAAQTLSQVSSLEAVGTGHSGSAGRRMKPEYKEAATRIQKKKVTKLPGFGQKGLEKNPIIHT